MCVSLKSHLIQLAKGWIKREMGDFVNTIMKILHDKETSDFLITELVPNAQVRVSVMV
jgi:hypothetical protein